MYNDAINGKILAFSYALYSANNIIYVYFRVIPSENVSLTKLFEGHYEKVEELKDVPLNGLYLRIFVPRKLVVSVRVCENVRCKLCENDLIDDACRNVDCQNYESLEFKVIGNNSNITLHTLQYVEDTIGCNGSDQIQTVCYRCASCKLCKRLQDKCRYHKICKHQMITSISTKRLTLNQHFRSVSKRDIEVCRSKVPRTRR